jgi:hypothetical protein
LTGGPYAPCPIMKIRPINLVQLKIEQASHREVDDQPRDAGGTTSPAGGSPPPAGG